MKKIGNLISASAGFLKMLVRAKAPTKAWSMNGHAILEGWEESPDEKIVSAAREMASVPKTMGRVGLFCFAGPHQGELFSLRERVERIAVDTGASLVLTPSETAPRDSSYRVLVNGVITLTSESGTPFRLNGAEEQKAELFDYDEVELLGNRFLVLTFEPAVKTEKIQKGVHL